MCVCVCVCVYQRQPLLLSQRQLLSPRDIVCVCVRACVCMCVCVCQRQPLLPRDILCVCVSEATTITLSEATIITQGYCVCGGGWCLCVCVCPSLIVVSDSLQSHGLYANTRINTYHQGNISVCVYLHSFGFTPVGIMSCIFFHLFYLTTVSFGTSCPTHPHKSFLKPSEYYNV